MAHRVGGLAQWVGSGPVGGGLAWSVGEVTFQSVDRHTHECYWFLSRLGNHQPASQLELVKKLMKTTSVCFSDCFASVCQCLCACARFWFFCACVCFLCSVGT